MAKFGLPGSGKWTRQPPSVAQINKGIPYTKQSAVLWTPTTGLLNPTLGPILTKTGTVTSSVIKDSVASRFAVGGYFSTSGNSAPIVTSDGAGTGDFTVFVLDNTASSASFRTLVGQRADASPYNQFVLTANQNSAGAGAPGSLAFLTYSSAYTGVAYASALDGLPHVRCCVRRGTSLYLYQDGVLVASGSGTMRGITQADTRFGIGVAPIIFNEALQTDIAFVHALNRGLSDVEVADISRNIWQVFQPLSRNIYVESAATSAALTGTISGSNEGDIVTGGKTIILTLTGDTFLAAGTGPIGSTANTQALIDGITSAQAEATGWNAVVRAGLTPSNVVRTSSTVATITLPAFASYNISATETITATIPAAVLTLASPIVSSPTFTVTATTAGVSYSRLERGIRGLTRGVSAGGYS